MVRTVTHSEFRMLLKAYYTKRLTDGRKIPLLVYGTFGVGKSALVRLVAQEIAAKRKRAFIEWNTTTHEEKTAIMADPSQFFILLDVRLSEFDSSDIKGLPDFHKDSDTVEWKPPYWAKLLENPASDGILFFDEINLAPPLVISSVYKIIYDRVINEGKINDHWLIIGCGNKSDDHAYTQEIAAPVRDRGGEVELLPPPLAEWLTWAIPAGIDSRIIGFLNWKPDMLHLVDYENSQKFTTARGWERVSSLIKNVKEPAMVELLTSTAISEGVSREFNAFCKLHQKVNIDEIISNPSRITVIKDVSTRYFVLTALAEQYQHKKFDFSTVLALSEVLDKEKLDEFVILFWRLCMRYAPDIFTRHYTDPKHLSHPLRNKYSAYLR